MFNSVVTTLAIISAVAATVLAFIFLVPDKKAARLNKFGKLVHNFITFKYLIIEKIFQALYIFATAAVVLFGFFNLFVINRWAGWMGGYGLILMIVGPIAIRIFYEMIMLFILLIKHVMEINSKLKNQNGDKTVSAFDVSVDDFKGAKPQPQPQPAPQMQQPPMVFCTNCGGRLDATGHCPNCGK